MLKKIILIFAFIAIIIPSYACCGGASISQYESALNEDETHMKAREAASEYLKLKNLDQVAIDAIGDIALNIETYNSYFSSLANMTTLNLIATIFMIDHDLNIDSGCINGNYIRSGYRDKVNRHKLDGPSCLCHLQHEDPKISAQNAILCPHHAVHFDEHIKPAITRLLRSKKEGS